MADKYTKKPSSAEAGSPPADAWKDVNVEKEYTPAKVKENKTYRQLESEIESIDSQVVSLGERKVALEAEMAKVKAAVEA